MEMGQLRYKRRQHNPGRGVNGNFLISAAQAAMIFWHIPIPAVRSELREEHATTAHRQLLSREKGSTIRTDVIRTCHISLSTVGFG